MGRNGARRAWLGLAVGLLAAPAFGQPDPAAGQPSPPADPPGQQSGTQPGAQNPPASSGGQPAPACVAPEYGQFDFWVGSWEVYRTGRTRLVARSLIEKLYDGCGIRENWMPIGAAGGGSLNSFVPQAGEWRQIWIDSSNSWAEFRGGLRDGAMVLTGIWRGMNGPGSEPLVRISYIPQGDGAVRQFGEQSTDNGQTWAPAFDLTYRRSSASSDSGSHQPNP